MVVRTVISGYIDSQMAHAILSSCCPLRSGSPFYPLLI
ncbi:hypothetical protein M5D96_001275 [Drosophila gunungcola]|uniref:Uncharacterized protein n=1 Tax=Drosophila gunungcola TaxID=103775 RepID=A0A9Q0BUJ3_9MUSC|nr:hypothetical protein M5D96_001275 [Drosophila gunungcola]